MAQGTRSGRHGCRRRREKGVMSKAGTNQDSSVPETGFPEQCLAARVPSAHGPAPTRAGHNVRGCDPRGGTPECLLGNKVNNAKPVPSGPLFSALTERLLAGQRSAGCHSRAPWRATFAPCASPTGCEGRLPRQSCGFPTAHIAPAPSGFLNSSPCPRRRRSCPATTHLPSFPVWQ